MNHSILKTLARSALGATVFAFGQLPPALAEDTSAANHLAARLQASGTRLTIPDAQAGTVSVTTVRPGAQQLSSSAQSFALNPELPYVLSADGGVLAGLRQDGVDGSISLVVFDTATAVRIGRLPLTTGEHPDGIWVNSKGTAVGVFLQGRFLAYELKGNTYAPRPVFERPTSLFLASPSGRLITLATDSGDLVIIDSASWKELPKAQASVQRTVKEWLSAKKMRPVPSPQDGPFVFPVAPLEVTADDRLMAVSLGENANTFLNMCMSTGALMSSVVFDKRVNAEFKFSNSGRQFSVQVLPNNDDPSFQRSASDYGLQIYDSYSGRRTLTLAIPRGDWGRYSKSGAKFFLDDWVGWLGFVKGDKSVVRFDSASKLFRTQSVGPNAKRDTAAEPKQLACPLLGR